MTQAKVDMTAETTHRESRGSQPPQAWRGIVAVGGVLTGIGAAAILLPMATALAIDLLLGVLLLLAGLAQSVRAYYVWQVRNAVTDTVWAALCLIVGIALLASPLQGVVALSLILAVLFVFEGVARIVFAMRLPASFDRRFPVIEGVAGIVIGVFLWMRWPSDAAWLIGLLVGIRFLLAGLPILIFGLRARSRDHSATTPM